MIYPMIVANGRYTLPVFMAREHGRHFWTPVNTAREHGSWVSFLIFDTRLVCTELSAQTTSGKFTAGACTQSSVMLLGSSCTIDLRRQS